jgi:hypothetical protein
MGSLKTLKGREKETWVESRECDKGEREGEIARGLGRGREMETERGKGRI